MLLDMLLHIARNGFPHLCGVLVSHFPIVVQFTWKRTSPGAAAAGTPPAFLGRGHLLEQVDVILGKQPVREALCCREPPTGWQFSLARVVVYLQITGQQPVLLRAVLEGGTRPSPAVVA